MTMLSVTPDPGTASMILEDDFPGTGMATTWRYINNKPQEVRGYTLRETGQEVPPFRDYEAPMGVQVGYSSLNWTTTKPAPPVTPQVYATLNVVDTTGWIKFPARPELNFAMDCITELPERRFAGNSQTYRIIGRSRPIAIHDVMTWWEGAISWVCPTLLDHDRQAQVLVTGSICMVQTMPNYGAINEFVLVTELSTAHIGPTGTGGEHPQRLMTMGFVTIDEPVGVYTVDVTYTYNQMKSDWPDYDSVSANYDTYYDLYLNDRR